MLFRSQPATNSDEPTPTDAEAALLAAWTTPNDAMQWAVKEGTCDNTPHAREAWTGIVKNCGGFSKSNAQTVYLMFIRDRQAKKQAATPPQAAQQENVPGDAETQQEGPPDEPGDIWDEAPDPVGVAVGELTGQKLGVILEWGMAHGQMSKEKTRALWDSITRSTCSRR